LKLLQQRRGGEDAGAIAQASPVDLRCASSTTVDGLISAALLYDSDRCSATPIILSGILAAMEQRTADPCSAHSGFWAITP
jgi:hypothetical protein